MSVVWISVQTATFALCNINRLVLYNRDGVCLLRCMHCPLINRTRFLFKRLKVEMQVVRKIHLKSDAFVSYSHYVAVITVSTMPVPNSPLQKCKSRHGLSGVRHRNLNSMSICNGFRTDDNIVTTISSLRFVDILQFCLKSDRNMIACIN
jgi:hypothetical protein